MTAPRLTPATSTLVVIDVQDKLLAKIPTAAALVRNAGFLIDAARLLGVPVLATEQYPKGLGPTTPELARRLPADRPAKTAFSCCGAAGFLTDLRGLARPNVVLAGMETHVCVYQTARDLIESGEVHVVADAVCSRTEANWRIGIDRMRADAATITSTEMVVFDLLGKAGTDDFKALSKLIKVGDT